jgi:hypothetical protein
MTHKRAYEIIYRKSAITVGSICNDATDAMLSDFSLQSKQKVSTQHLVTKIKQSAITVITGDPRLNWLAQEQ